MYYNNFSRYFIGKVQHVSHLRSSATTRLKNWRSELLCVDLLHYYRLSPFDKREQFVQKLLGTCIWGWYFFRKVVSNNELKTYFMELSPSWEAANYAATQELLRILRNPKVNYHVHKNPSLVPILSQIDPVHTTPFCLRSILILSTHLQLCHPSDLFPSVVPTNILYALFFSSICATCPANVRRVPCEHGMARPQVADAGDGLHIFRVAANIVNKQSRTADRGWFSILGVGPKTPHLRNKFFTKCHTGPWTWTDSLYKRPKLKKMDMGFETWNISSE
jgi:hypothetical protein